MKDRTAEKSVWLTVVIPYGAVLAALLAATVTADLALHKARLVWVGRYLGIPGTILIVASFLYSLRKRDIILLGSLKRYLALHEVLSWLGALMVLVHCGTHVNGILAWLAALSLVVAVVSGLTGRHLLKRSLKQLSSRRESMLRQGISETETLKRLVWDALAVDAMRRWRAVHLPITLAFCVLTGSHILAALFLGTWP